jgi:hypothetical protein
LSIDVDRWWKQREGIALKVAVCLTVNPPPSEAFFKRINDLQEPLMIEWE